MDLTVKLATDAFLTSIERVLLRSLCCVLKQRIKLQYPDRLPLCPTDYFPVAREVEDNPKTLSAKELFNLALLLNTEIQTGKLPKRNALEEATWSFMSFGR